MVIIVEGIDRIGKTTLCNALSKKLGFPIYKELGVEKKSREGNVRSQMALIGLCQKTDCNVIFDRMFTSECVYGMIDRGYPIKYAINDFNCALAEAAKIPHLVYVGMKSTDIKKSSAEHGKELSKHECMFDTMQNFVKEKIDKVFLECTYFDIDNLVEKIYAYYLDCKEEIEHAKCTGTIDNEV